MQILEYSELTPAQRRLSPTTDFSDAVPPSALSRIDRIRLGGERILRYRSLHAVERGVPLARVGSNRVTWVHTTGESETVCGVSDVMTRADAVRRRYATRLVLETHRRARAEGLRWSFLWTHRSWAAHRAYERLGYRDVYSPPFVTRAPRRHIGRSTRSVTLRPARRSDAARLDRLFAEASATRVGFVRRPKGWFAWMFRVGWRTPAGVRMVRADGRIVGYLTAALDRADLISREVVVPDPAHHAGLLDALDRLARGRWIGIHATTFVTDAEPALVRHGYDRVAVSHPVMMACPLRGVGRDGWAELRRTIDDPRFALHAGDMV